MSLAAIVIVVLVVAAIIETPTLLQGIGFALVIIAMVLLLVRERKRRG
jgi:drug/metabolite transporter (DMT)-like permease